MRIMDRPAARQEGDRYFFEVGRGEEFHLMVLRLNALYGVSARVLEAGDGERQPR